MENDRVCFPKNLFLIHTDPDPYIRRNLAQLVDADILPDYHHHIDVHITKCDGAAPEKPHIDAADCTQRDIDKRPSSLRLFLPARRFKITTVSCKTDRIVREQL